MVVKDNILYGPHKDISVTDVKPIHHLILEKLQDSVAKCGNIPWMTDFSTGQTISYAEILPKVKVIVSNLLHHGLQAGDFVLFSCGNHVMLPLAKLAVWCCHGVVVLLKDVAGVEAFRDVTLRFIICDDKTGSAAKACADKLINVTVFSLVPFDGLRNISSEDAAPTKLINEGSEMAVTAIDTDSPVLMLNTSGTTGIPKWVVHTHKSLTGMVKISASEHVTSSEDEHNFLFTTFSMMAICGMFGNLTSFLSDKSHAIMSDINDHSILEVMQNNKKLAVSLYPSQLTMIAKFAEKECLQFPNVISITTGGYRTSPALRETLVNIMPNLKHFTEIYAMTESPVGTFTRDAKDAESIGKSCSAKLLPCNLLKIVDLESGQILGPGETGEICVKSPGTFKGYWNSPQATASVLHDGWLHTGDVGHYDENGFIFVSQRIKELIDCTLDIPRRVDIKKVENLLVNHPAIEDTVVLGKLDDRYGEVPAAVVVLKKGSCISEQDVVDYVNDRVADHEKLRGGVRLVDSIPRTDNGKPLKRLLQV